MLLIGIYFSCDSLILLHTLWIFYLLVDILAPNTLECYFKLKKLNFGVMKYKRWSLKEKLKVLEQTKELYL